jgi:hypothetical protein
MKKRGMVPNVMQRRLVVKIALRLWFIEVWKTAGLNILPQVLSISTEPINVAWYF